MLIEITLDMESLRLVTSLLSIACQAGCNAPAAFCRNIARRSGHSHSIQALLDT
jgi:hypothetical protein